MASVIGTNTITEYNINVAITTNDGKSYITSNGQGKATIDLTIDRGAVGAINAIRFNPLYLTFNSIFMGELMGTKQYVEQDQPTYTLGRTTPVGIYELSISRVPGYPLDLATEYFDVNVVDERGIGMVCTLLSNGTLTGDINTSESYYDDLTGELFIEWVRPMKQGQNVIYRKNYTSPPATPVEFTLTDLVGYQTVLNYTLAAKTISAEYNKHMDIAPGSVKITTTDADGLTVTVTDDGNGNLVGDVLSTVTTDDEETKNTIDYHTGEINITFNTTLAADVPINIKHTSLLPVKEYHIPDSKSQGEVKIALPWEDLARIVRSIEQVAGVAETGLKYKANT